MKEKWKKLFWTNCASALFPAVTVFLLSPMEIVSGNLGELPFGMADVFWGLLLITAGCVCILGAALTFLPERLSKALRAVVFVFSLMAYLQNMFLNPVMMQKDGSRLNWQNLRPEIIRNGVVWGAALLIMGVLCCLGRKHLDKVTCWGSLFVSAVELAAVISILITAPFGGKEDACVLDGAGQFQVAKGSNIIVLILDRYGTVTFDNKYEKSGEFRETYKDFIYYTNANSTYNYTFPSITYMLTHVEPDCSQTSSVYKKKAWEEGKGGEFYDILHKRGYEYHLYTTSVRSICEEVSDLRGRVDNIAELEKGGSSLDYGRIYFLLFKMSLYKHAPYLLKPHLEVPSYLFDGVISYHNVRLPIEDNADFYDAIRTTPLSVNEDMENAFIIQQLSGIHTPYTLGEDGQRVEENDTELSACEDGLNKLVGDYLGQLKAAGVYDSATIIIMADHGLYKDSLDPQPIFFLKHPGQHFEEAPQDRSPISSEDFLATILEAAGAETEGFGKPVSEWKETDVRERSASFPMDGFQKFTYTGDRETLRDKIEEDDFEWIRGTYDWN